MYVTRGWFLNLVSRFAQVLGEACLSVGPRRFVPPLPIGGRLPRNGAYDLLTSLGAYLAARLSENACDAATPEALEGRR